MGAPRCVGEQSLQPLQPNGPLSDLGHQAKAASADDPPADFGGAAVPVRGLSELFDVHAFTSLEPA
jgi:hypothetical protein